MSVLKICSLLNIIFFIHFPDFLQGLGLFSARDLDKHTMVIEYIGDLIRNEVANKREIVYEAQVNRLHLLMTTLITFCFSVLCVNIFLKKMETEMNLVLFFISNTSLCSPSLMFQNRGVYMFRSDTDTVIDATMVGGLARYINHSCNPNCVAEVVPFEKESKIIIITSRRIVRGEEVINAPMV